jgi:hypothetical protein
MKNSSDSVKCPKCGESIPITETLQNQLTERARAEIKRELASEQKTLLLREREVQARESKVQDAEQDIEERVAKRLATQKTKLSKESFDKAREEVALEVKALQQEATEKDQRLQEAQNKELQLRKDKRELESRTQSLELEVIRKVDAERETIRTEALEQAAEEHRLKDAEKDKKLRDALKINEDLNRKLQQGSQQTQGEVLELELEEILRDCCRSDEILPVPKGVRGADVLHKVNNKSGILCGTIIWEAKHTKKWSDGWISKLKDDQQQARADVAVLVTDALPDDIKEFGKKEGVWITLPKYVPGVVLALRGTLEEVAQTKRAVASKNETVETLFNYLTGTDFTNRVEGIMRSFIAMKQELDEEKRVTTRRWAKREKQLDIVIMNMSGMYGDLQGLLGTSLKPIPALDTSDDDEPGDEVVTLLDLAAQEGQDEIPL